MLSILQRYVARSYVSAWILAMLVLSFVLSIGLAVRAAQLVVKGFPPTLVLRFLWISFPESLTFTVPLASLVSALLLFGRLSADGEISAMRACGVNIWRIMFPLAVFGAALTALSIHINGVLAPYGSRERHELLYSTTRSKDLLKLLEPGHFIRNFNGVDIWFESQDGDVLNNLIILEKTKSGATRETRCEQATLEPIDSDIVIDMRNVRITPFSENQPGTATVRHLTHTIKNATQRNLARRKAADFTNGEIRERLAAIDAAMAESNPDDFAKLLSQDEKERIFRDFAKKHDRAPEALTGEARDQAISEAMPRLRSSMLTELNRRYSFGLAPIAFLLLGMPLGIRTSRRESNVGIAVSLCVMLVYYAFMIAAKSIAETPAFYPHIVIWAPTAACAVLSAILVRRNQ